MTALLTLAEAAAELRETRTELARLKSEYPAT